MKPAIIFCHSILLLILLWIGAGCKKDKSAKPANPSPACDTTNTVFNQLYNSLLVSPNLVNDTTMDTYLHSYTFEVASNKTICKIGYQNLGENNVQPDLVEIYDNTLNSLLYSGSHHFSSAATSYVSVAPIALTVGNSYTISRKRIYLTYVDELIGRVIRRNDQNDMSYPVIFGDLKIISSSFFNSNNNPGIIGIPYIDLVFE